MTMEPGLDAILAAPLANAPRLAWADAVGGPRGELVRNQIRLDAARRSVDVSLRARCARLVAADGHAWAAGVRDIATAWEFERGFVERVTVDARTFLDRGHELLAVAPINHVRLRGTRAVDPAALFESPLWDGILALDLTGERLGDAAVRTLAGSAHFGELRWLALGDNDLHLEAAEALMSLPRLGWVAFGGNHVDPTPSPGGVDWMDGQILSWDMAPEGVELVQRYGRRPWLGIPDAWPVDLYDLVRPTANP
jgi:hypothetical protein